MRILILSFIPSQELTGLVLLELCALPLMNCRKVGMLTKSSQMGGFNIYIFFSTAFHESQGSKPHFVTANPDISHRDFLSFFFLNTQFIIST